jgi:2-methylcitrate dehydratase PrpD
MILPQFSEYIWSTNYNQLPESVVNKAKECFIDFLGVTIKGSKTKSGSAVKNIIQNDGLSTVFGMGKTSALEAGLANGIFAHSLDLDDGHRQAQLHPGACVIPAALSLCQAENRSGKEFITSLVVGYQVAIILGLMVNPEHRDMGFHSTGTCGTFGAAAAACKALKLSQSKITNALGLAGTQAAGLLESDHSGSMGKHLNAGKAAQSGILSALLAQEDFTGSETILEGNEGFINVMVDNKDHKIDKQYIDEELKSYKILEVYFKIYPVCRHLHSSIDALLHIIQKKNIDSERIENIKVETYRIAAEHHNHHPDSNEALKQSLPVSMALALLNIKSGKNNLNEFDYPSTNPLFNQQINDLVNKIHIIHQEDLDKQYPHNRPAKVTVKTEKELYEKTVALSFGEPENPLKKSDILWKFHSLVPRTDGQFLQIMEKLESYNNINHFMEHLQTSLDI